nr:calcium/sodium antiporter [Verrucomicrobiota bacterium JB025]
MFLVLGLVLLVAGAEYLVRGAANLAVTFGVSALVVGLTVVAFGTSAPELAVSVVSAYKGESDMAIGNVVGSNVFNILVILGLSAVIVPLSVNAQLVRFDVPVMIVISFLLLPLGWNGLIDRTDGVLLAGGAVVYTVYLIYQSRKEKDEGVKAEYEEEFGAQKGGGSVLKNLGLVVIGMVGLVLGSKWLVSSSIEIAKVFGVSEMVIGLTIVAVGTSLPEVATSVVAAVRGERDIAVGNAVGSNIFNLLCVLGFGSIVAPDGLEVSQDALRFDIPVMIGVAVACLPVFFSGFRVRRWEGLVFLAMYGLYMAHVVLKASGHPAFANYERSLLLVVFPALALIFLVTGVMALRKND